jgi:signal transduction histidine kinase/DNA-binding response OmpR family regulator
MNEMPMAAPNKASLLVVDDEEELLQIFAEFLGGGEYELELASTGLEAIEKLDQKHFDLVVTDLNLPGADGLAVMRHARGVASQPEVIMLTGNASTVTAIEALRQGAYDYVLKPFDLYEMDQTIRKALERRRLLADNERFVASLQTANAELEVSEAAVRKHRDELKGMVEEATRRIRTLYEVGKEITSSLHLSRTLSLILERSLSLTGGSEGALFLLADSSGLPECRVSRGLEEGSPAWAGLVAALYSVNERVLTLKEPVRQDLAWPEGEERSALVVPLLQEGEVSGMVAVLKGCRQGFSSDDQELLVSLVAQASIAINNARIYEKIRDLERLKSEFVAVVSHEVRTPLTSIKGSLEVLADEKYFQVEAPQKDLLSICRDNVNRLEVLINDILDFSKLESSRLSSNFVPTSLASLTESAVLSISNLAKRRQIRIVTEIAPDLPAIAVDELRITQVINNLVSNAIKFSASESEIRILACVWEDGVRVEIRDSGIGIPPEDLPKLFIRFRQLDSSSTRKAGGTGLGLTISKGIVEEHGGRIWAESVPGQGSSFFFWLPTRVPGVVAPGGQDELAEVGRVS